MRRKGECLAKRKNGHLIYNVGNNNEAKNRIGFIINKRLESHIEEVVGINERTAYTKLKLNAKYSIKIIQLYAQTTDHEDEEVEELYEEISKLLREVDPIYNCYGRLQC